jgi:hypothetical protein
MKRFKLHHYLLFALALFILYKWMVAVPAPNSPRREKVEVPRPVAGELKHLQTNSDKIIVARSEAILDRTITLSLAKDVDGVTRQVTSNECFIVDQYTPVRIIQGRSEISEVRITEGPMKGESGFVPNGFIK